MTLPYFSGQAKLSRSRSTGLAWLAALACLVSPSLSAAGKIAEIRPVLVDKSGVAHVEYRCGDTLVGRAGESAPAGVELLLPGAKAVPVRFPSKTPRDGVIELGPTTIDGLTFLWRITQKNPSLVERTLEVTAKTAGRFTLRFPLDTAIEGEFESFSGPEKSRVLYDTGVRERRNQTFPVAMLRASDGVLGIVADSPGLWENRCQVLLDPQTRRLAVLTGDGGDPFQMIIKPPEDARDTYQYSMDGWQSLAAGETRRFTSWVFTSPARDHYDAQLAVQLAVANAKGWNSSALEAILRDTSLYLLRRNLMRDENNQPREGKYIFISGMTYGWKQWVSTGIYSSLGLNDPEKTIESYRAVFWNRMDYEDNSQYYLIWAALAKRAGGTVNEPLVRKAYEFIRRNEKDGLFIPPSLPGAPDPKGWKTYMDILPYNEGDAPASNQGFHCGALMAARELGLPVAEADIERAISAYQRIFNTKLGFMPTSLMKQDILGQDTLYGATLTYAVFGRKVLTDEQVLSHYRVSEKVKSPHGLRVISAADGSLLPGHRGEYCHGGSWFFCDSGNYLLAGAHGLPSAEVDARLIERIKLELTRNPAFNEDINTVTGQPHGNTPYADYSAYIWLRDQFRRRLGQTGRDPVAAAIDARLGVVREDGVLRLDPIKPVSNVRQLDDPDAGGRMIGYTEFQTNLPGGRHANIRTQRAAVVNIDGTERRLIAPGLADKPDAWTQFVGWSPDGRQAIVYRGWQDHENARWEEEHKTFRFEPGKWLLDSCLFDMDAGTIANVTAVDRVSHYNGGLFFMPDGRALGFTPLIDGVSRPFVMDLDGRNKRDLSGSAAGFSYGYSASPDGKLISFHENYQISIANSDGSGKRRVETGNPFNFGPRWSPDGDWLLFLSGEHGRSNPFIVRRDGTGLRKLADQNGYQGWVLFLDVDDFHQGSSDTPAWSADGRSVFYSSRVDSSVELFQAPIDGSCVQLTKSPPGTLHYHPEPSADGKWLVYGTKRDGVRQIEVMRLADRTQRPVTRLPIGHAAMWPHWRPLMKQVATQAAAKATTTTITSTRRAGRAPTQPTPRHVTSSDPRREGENQREVECCPSLPQ